MFDAHDLVVMTRAEAQSLLARLDEIKSTAPRDGAARSAEFDAAVTGCYDQFRESGWVQRADDLREALDAARNGGNGGVALEDGWTIRGYVLEAWNAWDRLGNGNAGGADNVSRTGAGGGSVAEFLKQPPATVLQAEAELRTILERIVKSSADLTVYDDVKRRLEERLAPLAVGKAIDFSAVFEAYLPDSKQREDILKQLSNDANFAGAVELSRGLVYRTSNSKGFRFFTYMSPLVFFAVAFGVLVGASSLHSIIGGIPAKLGPPWYKLIGPYLLVMIGVIAHLVAANLKQAQSGAQIVATQDILTWLHLRWAGLALTYVHVVIVVIALRVLGTGDSGHDVMLWIAAGYSVDSLAGLVLNRFGTGSSALTQVSAVLGA